MNQTDIIGTAAAQAQRFGHAALLLEAASASSILPVLFRRSIPASGKMRLTCQVLNRIDAKLFASTVSHAEFAKRVNTEKLRHSDQN